MGLLSFGRRSSKRTNSNSDLARQLARRANGRVRFEQLEQRSMLTISATIDGLQSDGSIQEPAGKDIFVPITSTTDDGSTAITYSATSSNPAVTVSVVPGDTYLTLNVNGTSSGGTAYSGTLTFKLFDTLTPNTVNEIETQVADGLYNNTTFARVLNSLSDILIAQGNYTSSGGNPTGTGSQFDDEFNSQLTFDSQGVIAWANAGPDTNDTQYFISGIDEPGTSTPLNQSDLSATRSLDYRYTIFGQLVDGFSTFNTMMNSTLVANPSGPDGTTPDTPSPLINVSSASIVTNDLDTVLDISAPSTATGTTADITVNGVETGGDGATTEEDITVNVVADTVIDPPFLGAISPTGIVSTTEGTPITITLPITNVDGATLNAQIVDPTTGAAPANVTIGTIDPSTGQVTLTPGANFTGSISLLAAVSGTNAVNTSFDTQPFTLTVNPAAAPAAPTNLTATALATNEIGLSWTGSTSTVTGYNVFRGTTAGAESGTPLNSTPLSASATSFNDLTATPGTTFFYTVQAINSGTSSGDSNEASATALTSGPTVPGSPTNLTASAASADEIDLTWTAATVTITGYNVFRGTAIGGESTTPLNSSPLLTTSFQDTTASAGTTYFYVVQAVDSTASSASSNEATATTSGSSHDRAGRPDPEHADGHLDQRDRSVLDGPHGQPDRLQRLPRHDGGWRIDDTAQQHTAVIDHHYLSRHHRDCRNDKLLCRAGDQWHGHQPEFERAERNGGQRDQPGGSHRPVAGFFQ